MRNFHNVVSDILEGFYIENLNVHIERDNQEEDTYLVTLDHEDFTVVYQAILGRIPMVRITQITTALETIDEDNSFICGFQSELIDELYCNDVE